MNDTLKFIAYFLAAFLCFSLVIPKTKEVVQKPIVENIEHDVPIIEEPKIESPDIKQSVDNYFNYNNIVKELKYWNEQAPELTEVKTYGKSTRGSDLCLIKINNKHISKNKPKVLITACIHGNEVPATAITMEFFKQLLNSYGEEDRITKLIDEREIWYVPVVSPDSYPNSRYVDGVDPNRNFPGINQGRSPIPPIKALMDLYNSEKFDAVASSHTNTRQYLIPWGCSYEKIEHEKEYKEIIGEMARMSNYELCTPKEIYRRPIYGAELDWYHTQGALSIVIEFGPHQRIPSKSETDNELNRTKESLINFIDKAPIAF